MSDLPDRDATLSRAVHRVTKPSLSDRPKPHPVPPHICGHATTGELDPQTERCIEYAVYGPKNWLNVDQLRRRIHELVKEALEKAK